MPNNDKECQCVTSNHFGGSTDMVLRLDQFGGINKMIFLHKKRNANAINLNSLVISVGCIAVNYFYFIVVFA